MAALSAAPAKVALLAHLCLSEVDLWEPGEDAPGRGPGVVAALLTNSCQARSTSQGSAGIRSMCRRLLSQQHLLKRPYLLISAQARSISGSRAEDGCIRPWRSCSTSDKFLPGFDRKVSQRDFFMVSHDFQPELPFRTQLQVQGSAKLKLLDQNIHIGAI